MVLIRKKTQSPHSSFRFGYEYEVWSILGALEVPYTPQKIILTKIIYGLQLLLQKNFGATQPTRVSLSKIGTDQYYSP